MEHRPSILIVDDTPQNLRLLGDILENEGYDLRVATSGPDALDAVKTSAPDLILMDIVMPGMDGYEVCRQLKADPGLRSIPVIFISALGMAGQKVHAFHEGAVDYITKPFQTQEVVARVRTHLQLSKLEELKREITERRLAEEALRRSEEKFARAFQASPIIMTISSTSSTGDFRLIEVNEAFEKASGYTREEALASRTMVTDLWVDLAERERLLPILLANGRVRNEEMQFCTKSGKVFICLYSAELIELDGKKCVLATAENITERKRAEDAVRTSQEMLQLVLNNIPQGVFWKDRESRWLGCNEVVLRCHGIENIELVLGKTDCEIGLATLEQVEFFLQKDREVMESGRAQLGIIEQSKFADGSTRWLETNKIPMRDVTGKVIGLLGTWQDITERKRAEEALREMNQRYQRNEMALVSLTRSYALNPESLSEVLGEITEVVARTLEVERVGIWAYNPDRNSISCLELFEREESRHSIGMELPRQGHEAYFNAEDGSDVIAVHDVRVDGRTASLADAYMVPLGITSMMDAPLRARSGTAGVLCCEHVGPMRTWMADEQTFAVAVANLVSVLFAQLEQQRLEAQLRQTQKLEALGTLSGGIAHDFNNILGAIISFTELARMESPPAGELAE